MRTKQALLEEVAAGLRQGVITKSDLDTIAVVSSAVKPSDKTTAVDVMFYIAGIVLYAAMLSVIWQTWGSGDTVTHILMSAGAGLAMWAFAYYLVMGAVRNDIRKGLINALLLTGSLAVITGGFIITSKIVGGFDDMPFVSTALTLAILGVAHMLFDRLVKKDFIVLMGVLLSVAVFPTLLFGMLEDANAPSDVWFVIIIASAGLLAVTTRVMARRMVDRRKIGSAFDSLAAFVALGAMYAASFGGYGLLWSVGLIGGVLGIFYLSILSQNKHLLGSGSFFLVVMVITMSFRYFSGFGATASLAIAALGLLGTAAIASGINKRYFS